MPRLPGIGVAALFLLSPAVADAQSAADFYRGKTVNMIVGYPTGNSNDLYIRAVARHIGRHIPGNPNVIPRNMPGGGSLIAANHVFNVAPRDGTVLALMAASTPLEERLGAPNVRFKAAEFNWIGRMASGVSLAFASSRSKVKSIADAYQQELVFGASGRSSTTAIYPAVLANVIGVKFKVVMGYTGSVDSMLALERGEVDAHSTSLEALRAVHPDWIPDKKVIPLVQFALKRHRELKEVPTSWELGRNAEEQAILRIVANATEVGKYALTTPGTPPDRVDALRRAFDATVKDPAFLAEVKALRLELDPMSGEALQKLVVEVGAVPPAIIDKVKAIYPLN